MMTKSMIQRVMAHARRCRRSTKQLRSDTSGLAAVEFALIMPLMLTMLFGIIDVANGFAVDRKVSMSSQTLSDLTSRYTVVQETDVSNFFKIVDAMLTPFPTDTAFLKATVFQVYMDPASKTGKVVWSRGDVTVKPGTVVSVPTALVSKDASGNWLANQYLILSQVTYLYTPIIGWVVPKAGVTLSESSFTKPRQGTCVMMVTTCTPSAG